MPTPRRSLGRRHPRATRDGRILHAVKGWPTLGRYTDLARPSVGQAHVGANLVTIVIGRQAGL